MHIFQLGLFYRKCTFIPSSSNLKEDESKQLGTESVSPQIIGGKIENMKANKSTRVEWIP